MINGKDVANRPPIAAIRQGVAHVPEDRTGVGSAPNLTITENTIMKSYREEPIGNRLSIDLPERAITPAAEREVRHPRAECTHAGAQAERR
jgi:ABC-type uncharacterized transport system ATPase subunit